MPRDYVEFDVILRWRKDVDAFDVTLIYNHPENVEDASYVLGAPVPFDTDRLSRLVDDVNEYSAALSGMLYRDPNITIAVDRALRAEYPVYLRLLVDAEAPPNYQAIRWETLLDPGGTFALATKSQLYFSRYFSSISYRPLTPLPKEGQLTALVVVAAPRGLSDHSPLGGPELAAVTVDAELDSARRALPNVAIQTLPDGNDPSARATLDQIMERLEGRDGKGINLLYLVCHGMVTDEPKLLLEKSDGTVDEVRAATFADRIAALTAPPTVAVLCSCQSAGAGDVDLTSQAEPLAPFGPLLARAGVAVVLAMQGNVTVPTASTFLREFVGTLATGGLADRAASEARRMVQGRTDWWMPVLFSRLRHGRPWYEPRFGSARKRMFQDLWAKISEGPCTPVLGSGIGSEVFLPERSELAQKWVERRQMPIIGSTRNDLAKVAQYLSVDSGPDMPQTELRSFLREELKQRYARSFEGLKWDEPLRDLVQHVWERRCDQLGDAEPYTALASLNLPVYVTTSWANLLEKALEKKLGQEPTVRSFDWLQDCAEEDPLPKPTPERPLVYHMFGSLDQPASIVLTEDDYFAWLRAWMRRVDADKSDSIPGPVKSALTASPLVFLGYTLDDWEFRIMFQSIKSFPGNLRKKYQHVGVQLRPETASVSPEAAEDYLERYFGEDKISIYWGSSCTFLQDLQAERPQP